MNNEIAEKLGWDVHCLYDLPDFTHSLDACVKYIVPWLNENGFLVEFSQLINGCPDSGKYVWRVYLNRRASKEDESLTLALCKAFMEV